MTQFLSEQWVASFNEALSFIEEPGTSDLTSSDRPSFTLGQIVEDSPDGEILVLLEVDGSKVTMSLVSQLSPEPDVTVRLSWADALALNKGDLGVAEALTAGRVRVRGNLSALLGAHDVLARARPLLADFH